MIPPQHHQMQNSSGLKVYSKFNYSDGTMKATSDFISFSFFLPISTASFCKAKSLKNLAFTLTKQFLAKVLSQQKTSDYETFLFLEAE